MYCHDKQATHHQSWHGHAHILYHESVEGLPQLGSLQTMYQWLWAIRTSNFVRHRQHLLEFKYHMDENYDRGIDRQAEETRVSAVSHLRTQCTRLEAPPVRR